MTTSLSCPVCFQDAPHVQTAFISPWIRELSGTKRRKSSYRFCRLCQTGFFDYRYSYTEMNTIYEDYRGPRYFLTRSRWEPSYTRELDQALADDPEVLRFRHQMILECLALFDNRLQDSIKTVVDIGGDRGQFIPPVFPNRFVLEASNKSLVMETKRVESLTEVVSIQPNLVIVSGVLEHLPAPSEFLHEIAKVKSRNNAMYIYLEVPSGVPKKRTMLSRALSYISGSIACRLQPAWVYLDRLSAKRRLLDKSASRIVPMRQSEHLNFFSETSLKRLVENSGARICLVDSFRLPVKLSTSSRLQFSDSIRCLAQVD